MIPSKGVYVGGGKAAPTPKPLIRLNIMEAFQAIITGRWGTT